MQAEVNRADLATTERNGGPSTDASWAASRGPYTRTDGLGLALKA